MIIPTLLQTLQGILPGAWQPVRDGFTLPIPGGSLTVRKPYVEFIVLAEVGDEATQVKSHHISDLSTLIRRALGEELFATLCADSPTAIKALRNRRRSELNVARQNAEADLHKAQDALAAIEAQIAEFEMENP